MFIRREISVSFFIAFPFPNWEKAAEFMPLFVVT
jgi:hypothetical protein